jgi:phage terminase large subunit-like protein
VNYIEQYYKEIQAGRIVTSRRVEKKYKELVENIENPSNWIFNEELANRPIRFIEKFCKHSKGEWIGKPVTLELFQKAYISALFGFVNDEGIRRYKESFFYVSRKNGKSTLMAGLMLYMLMADKEGGAQVVSAATKKEQASIVFNECLNMVSQSADLRNNLKKRKTDLYFPLTFSTMNALSSDSNTLDGLNISLCVIDELHAIKDRNLYEVLKQGMSARRSPILIMITTAGTVRENIFDDMYDYASRVVDGAVDDERFLAVMYELDDRSEWTDETKWIKANPSLGNVKKIEDLRDKVERAKVNSKDLSGILVKDFNIRDTLATSWLNFDDINNEETWDISDLAGSYAVGGVDLSSTTDLTCATLVLMKPDSNKKFVIQQYFMPDERLDIKVNEDKIPYHRWHERGLVTLSSGNRVNYSDVTAWFVKMIREHEIRPLWIGYDSWNAQYFTQEMKDAGFDMVEVRQGYKSLSTPMKELEADLMSRSVNYNNNPILKWCLTNTATKEDENGNIRPMKGIGQRMRIDGAVSLIIAYAVLTQNLHDYKTLILR